MPKLAGTGHRVETPELFAGLGVTPHHRSLLRLRLAQIDALNVAYPT
jgi:hypothetical protein